MIAAFKHTDLNGRRKKPDWKGWAKLILFAGTAVYLMIRLLYLITNLK